MFRIRLLHEGPIAIFTVATTRLSLIKEEYRLQSNSGGF